MKNNFAVCEKRVSVNDSIKSKWNYIVQLHQLPEYKFLVEADNIDQAQKIAFDFVQNTKGGLSSDAATITAR